MQGWYCVESLTGQRHDRVQTESQIATVDSCFDLVRSLQHSVASCEVFSCSTEYSQTHYMQMVMTSDETQNPNLCQLANVTSKTRDKGQQESLHHFNCTCKFVWGDCKFLALYSSKKMSRWYLWILPPPKKKLKFPERSVRWVEGRGRAVITGSNLKHLLWLNMLNFPLILQVN